MTEIVESPLIPSEKVSEIGRIKSREIIEIYRTYFDMDVAPYFKNLEEVKILKCETSHYMFYYPFSTEGDESYYGQMGKFDWYYNPSRWEHGKAMDLIQTGDFVLEVGAGSGFFLNELKKKNIRFEGLELNGKAIEEAKKMGVAMQKELVQDHASRSSGKYDIVCSFQVLEHISQPLGFLEAKISCLRKGGKLIIGVPNNDSYMKDNQMYNKVLNMPPHHMGLWTYDSLKSLEKIFPVKLLDVYYEPLVGGNVDVYMWNKVNRFFLGISFFTRAFWKLKLHGIVRYFINKKAHKIRGNSMLAVFEKK
jgi:2-polyprenyl-3-methyl-5-hydroxy-6-metoxy-1,4-benzoquinol methylase